MGRIQHGVYVIVHAQTGRPRYVGQTDDSIDQRLQVHRREGRYNPSTDVIVREMIHNSDVRDNIEASLIRSMDPTQNTHREKNHGIIPRIRALSKIAEIEAKVQVLSKSKQEW